MTMTRTPDDIIAEFHEVVAALYNIRCIWRDRAWLANPSFKYSGNRLDYTLEYRETDDGVAYVIEGNRLPSGFMTGGHSEEFIRDATDRYRVDYYEKAGAPYVYWQQCDPTTYRYGGMNK